MRNHAAPHTEVNAADFAAQHDADLIAFAEARLEALGARPSAAQRLEVVDNLRILQAHVRAALIAAREGDR